MDYTNFALQTAQQASRAIITVPSNTASFEGQNNLTLVNEVRRSLQTTGAGALQTTRESYVRPIPSTGIVTTLGYVSTTSDSTATTTIIYNPANEDQRRTLEANRSITQTLSGTQRVATPASGNQAASETNDNFTTTRVITFLGKANQQIGNQTVEACRFRTSVTGQLDVTEWVYRGLTIRQEVADTVIEQATSLTVSR